MGGKALLDASSSKDVVTAQVEAALKKLKVPIPSQKVRFSSLNYEILAHVRIFMSLEKGANEREWSSQEENYRQQAGSSSQQRTLSSSKTTREFEEKEGHRWLVRKISECLRAQWTYNQPSSYPDALLDLPLVYATKVLLSRVPLYRLEAARFRAEVHEGPGVNFPSNLAIHVSAGLKFMFDEKINAQLITDAYKEFERVINWRVYFETIPHKEPFDPDYRVENLKKAFIFSPKTFKEGLARGKAYVNSFIEGLSNKRPSIEPTLSKLVEIRDLRKHVIDNKLLILPTDKNLGSAVVKADWIGSKLSEMLFDEALFEQLDKAQLYQICDITIDRVSSHSTKAVQILGHKQMSKFIISTAPSVNSESDRDYHIPTLWGIPKIHKSPWKIRPIVPCHSNIQAPLAKIVSKLLGPLVRKQPYVTIGTKDLVIALNSTLKGRKPKHRWWICTGDVVAFYPSIPSDDAITISAQVWSDHAVEEGKLSPLEIQTYLDMIKDVNDNLVFQYQGQYFLQKDGLAMGLACSPDIANLYGARFENVWMNSDAAKDVVFYRRYIDDCLSIVDAPTYEDALRTCMSFDMSPCKLEWSVSRNFTVFLDLQLWFDEKTSTIEYMPYRKQRNHFERIPFASAHPLDVKKGTFASELSRLATLSSQYDYYVEATHEAALIFVQRGYPAELINSWIKLNLQARWNDRHKIAVDERESACA